MYLVSIYANVNVKYIPISKCTYVYISETKWNSHLIFDPAVPPAVSLPPSIVAPQGDPLSLDCGATGTPPPTVVWYKDGRLLSGNGRVTVSPSDRVVTITSLHSIDEGNYTCVASNRVGGASATSILTVLGNTQTYPHTQ